MLQIPQCICSQPSQSVYLQESNFRETVSSEEQNSLLQRMDEEIQRESLYFTIDLKENRILHCNGVGRWLGYADKDFSLNDYMRIIHPSHAAVQSYYAISLRELLKENTVKLQFMLPVCAAIIALRHKNGRYICCKRECAPFQLTEDNQMTEYLCRFTIINDFSFESFQTRIYPSNGNNIQIGERLSAIVRKNFEDNTKLSDQELKVLRKYAQQKYHTSEMIAKELEIKKSTVDTYNKRILTKAESFSQQRFDTAKEAALYFKKAGLI